MKRKILFTIALGLCFALVLGVSSSAWAAAKPIEVIYDGSKIAFDVQPQSLNGRTMVPFRQIFETLGYDVDWNEAAKTVTAQSKTGDDTITLTLGSVNITKNGQTVQSDVPPITKNNRTLVPVRIVSELSGKDVLWDDYGPAVMIYSKLGDEAEPQVQSANQYMTAGGSKLFSGNYNQKSATETLMQLDLATGDTTTTTLSDPEFNGLQWTGDKLFIEGIEDFHIYSPTDGSVQTYPFQPTSWLYNAYFYEGSIYGAHCYSLKSGQKIISTQDFAKLNPTDNQISLLNDEMLAERSYIIHDGRVFNDGAVEDMATGKVAYVDQSFNPQSEQYDKYSDRLITAEAVHGDYYYFSYFTDDYYYWSGGCPVIRYNYKTGEKQNLNINSYGIITSLAVTNNSIYYATLGDTIYRADLYGKHIIPLAEEWSYNTIDLIISNNQIIYKVYDDDDICYIKAMNTDGSNHRTLHKSNYKYSQYDY